MPNNEDDNNYSPIQCQLYDYIEVACMRHYQLDIELTTSETITGKAITTKIKDRQEFIVIESENNEKQEIRLDLVKSIEPQDENTEFGRVAIS
jgi:Rho-binding antiterminator